MIPIRDSIPRVHTPVAVWTILGLNALAFLFQQGLTPEALNYVVHVFGVVPARLTDPVWAEGADFPGGALFATVSHMFLHGNLMHFLANMWSLWIFADNIEDVMGPLGFLAFYLLCGIAALACHVAFNFDSRVPIIGASGALAGVMGAYFLLYPHSKVLTLIPIFFIPYFIELPATVFLGIWFALQVVSGLSSLGQDAAGVAWWAHAGGFLAGMALLPLFMRADRCRYCKGFGGKDGNGGEGDKGGGKPGSKKGRAVPPRFTFSPD